MKKCKNCGGSVRANYIYCSNECLHEWHARMSGGGVSVIGSICRDGAKKLAIGMIERALRDGDFRWIYSKDSNLYFDIAGLQKHEVMDGYDDDLQPLFAVSKPYRRQEFQGMSIEQVADMHGMACNGLKKRLLKGMSWSEALAKPLLGSKP